MNYASTSEIALHLRVHRNTAALLLAEHRIRPSRFHQRPTYAWADVWTKLERVPLDQARDAKRHPALLQPLLTVEDVARTYQVHQATVRRYAASGRLPVIRLGDRIIRFRASDLVGAASW